MEARFDGRETFGQGSGIYFIQFATKSHVNLYNKLKTSRWGRLYLIGIDEDDIVFEYQLLSDRWRIPGAIIPEEAVYDITRYKNDPDSFRSGEQPTEKPDIATFHDKPLPPTSIEKGKPEYSGKLRTRGPISGHGNGTSHLPRSTRDAAVGTTSQRPLSKEPTPHQEKARRPLTLPTTGTTETTRGRSRSSPSFPVLSLPNFSLNPVFTPGLTPVPQVSPQEPDISRVTTYETTASSSRNPGSEVTRPSEPAANLTCSTPDLSVFRDGIAQQQEGAKMDPAMAKEITDIVQAQMQAFVRSLGPGFQGANHQPQDNRILPPLPGPSGLQANHRTTGGGNHQAQRNFDFSLLTHPGVNKLGRLRAEQANLENAILKNNLLLADGRPPITPLGQQLNTPSAYRIDPSITQRLNEHLRECATQCSKDWIAAQTHALTSVEQDIQDLLDRWTPKEDEERAANRIRDSLIHTPGTFQPRGMDLEKVDFYLGPNIEKGEKSWIPNPELRNLPWGGTRSSYRTRSQSRVRFTNGNEEPMPRERNRSWGRPQNYEHDQNDNWRRDRDRGQIGRYDQDNLDRGRPRNRRDMPPKNW